MRNNLDSTKLHSSNSYNYKKEFHYHNSYHDNILKHEKYWTFTHDGYHNSVFKEQKDSIWKRYDENGNLYEEIEYLDGVQKRSLYKNNKNRYSNYIDIQQNLTGTSSIIHVSSEDTTRIIIDHIDLLDEKFSKYRLRKFFKNKLIIDGMFKWWVGVSLFHDNSLYSINNKLILNNNNKMDYWREYGDNEKLLIETKFEVISNNWSTSNIQKNEEVYYNQSGDIIATSKFANGKRSGSMIDYYYDRNNLKTHDLVKSERFYKNGNLIDDKFLVYGYNRLQPSNNDFDPKSKKIILEGTQKNGIKASNWKISYPCEIDKIKWYKGIDKNKVLTNISSIRIKGKWRLSTIIQSGLVRNNYWTPMPSEGDDNLPEKILVRIEGEFKDDVQIGKWVAIDLFSNVILEEANYVDGQLNCDIISYYENGNVRFKGSYKKSERNGVWKYYFENGDLKATGKIDNNRPVGEWSIFNKKGVLLKQDEKYRFFGQLD